MSDRLTDLVQAFLEPNAQALAHVSYVPGSVRTPHMLPLGRPNLWLGIPKFVERRSRSARWISHTLALREVQHRTVGT